MRYSVLTYIFNHYEFPREIKVKDPDAEYILVTDDPDLKSDDWTVVYDKELDKLSPFEKCYRVRFNCFKYCHTDICVRIDGSVSVEKSLKPIIDAFDEGKYDCSLMIHPYRNNFIDEYNTWISVRGYSYEQAKRCINLMISLGYNFLYKGMFQGCFSITRRCELTDTIDKLTFFLLKVFGSDGNIERLDQTIFSFVINKYFNYIKVMSVSEEIYHHNYFNWFFHKTDYDIPYEINNLIEPYMFNQPCEIMKFE